MLSRVPFSIVPMIRSRQVRFSFIKRFGAGLAIAIPLSCWLATAPLSDMRPDHATTAASTSQVLPFPTPGQIGGFSLVGLFQPKKDELLWSGSVPLDKQEPDTIENVRLAIQAVDMTTVKPNEQFSFNDIVGIRTEEKGYRPGLMYSNGEVVMGVGGGICIASTALYRAVLENGLKIVERHPHSGPVSYADPGRDAAVSFGWADLRFKNNTPGALLIRAAVQDDKLTVALYGTKQTGRTVEILSEDYSLIPYQVIQKEDITLPSGQENVQQKPRDGYSITTVRVIRQDGKQVSREQISRDTVLPRNEVVMVSPDHGGGTPGIALPDVPMGSQSVSPLPLPDAAPLPLPTDAPTNDKSVK